MHHAWDQEMDALCGVPYPEIYIRNLRALPVGDGNLRLLLKDHPIHAAAWDAMEEHGLGREVVLIIDRDEYRYHAEVSHEDEIVVYLFPMPENDELPENERFLGKEFNLRLRW